MGRAKYDSCDKVQQNPLSIMRTWWIIILTLVDVANPKSAAYAPCHHYYSYAPTP